MDTLSEVGTKSDLLEPAALGAMPGLEFPRAHGSEPCLIRALAAARP